MRQQGVFAVLELAVGEALYQQAVSFRIAFPARREILKYYVVAKRYSQAELALLQVTDKGGEEPLTFLKTIAPDDAVARLLQEEEATVVLFQSEQTVRRFEKGRQRIQLTGNGDLLIRHLPQPGADRPYVEEISLFPPSVAEVETAIAAFIGYTEQALVKGLQKAWFTPTEITSFPDFQESFGGPPPVKVKRVDLDVNNMVTATEVEAAFYLYDSVRLFFQNGGGKCYIIAVGAFKDNSEPKKQHFKDGLAALRKQDEPTMILFPDAVLLQNDDLYELQQEALSQCGELGDRVAIFDLLESRSGNPAFDWKAGYKEFRDKIGINFLKYGPVPEDHYLVRAGVGWDLHRRGG